MNPGEWLTRGAIWLALALYAAAEIVLAASRRGGFSTAARWLNSAGCTAFLAHVTFAFDHYHRWSHAAAYADTARQTAAKFGLNWGGGIYLNYLFALVWLGEIAWCWTIPRQYLQRPRWVIRTVRSFFGFMIFNGTVVFVQGPQRWLGAFLCLTLAACWWPCWKPTVDREDPTKPA